ncbi:hypothetical protein AAG906_035820 [Vitis piasezkii]
MNSLVLYVGMQTIQQLQTKSSPPLAQQMAHNGPLELYLMGSAMDIFQTLIAELDTEGRYLFLNAIANQLRYPNNHTHFFSFVLLYLFVEASQEIIQEQITRVLLERLIVNRSHPWGLLITFIELIKNSRYNFWSRTFTRCAPEIEKLFESIFSVTVRVIQRDSEEKKASFNPRPYFRLFINWLFDLVSPDPILDGANFQVLIAFANAFHALQPLKIPAFRSACHAFKVLLSQMLKSGFFI